MGWAEGRWVASAAAQEGFRGRAAGRTGAGGDVRARVLEHARRAWATATARRMFTHAGQSTRCQRFFFDRASQCQYEAGTRPRTPPPLAVPASCPRWRPPVLHQLEGLLGVGAQQLGHLGAACPRGAAVGGAVGGRELPGARDPVVGVSAGIPAAGRASSEGPGAGCRAHRPRMGK